MFLHHAQQLEGHGARTTSRYLKEVARTKKGFEKAGDKKTPRAKNRTRGDALYRETVQEVSQRKVACGPER